MPKKKRTPLACDWKKTGSPVRMETHTENKSRLYKHRGNFTWRGIKAEKYKSNCGDWSDIVRQTLIGNHGETSKFHLRYFEIAPGGYSSSEMHKHEHVVIGIRGKGSCEVRGKTYDIGFLDTVYIEPNAPHQLRNTFDQPFGFLCLVNAKRDRPKILLTTP